MTDPTAIPSDDADERRADELGADELRADELDVHATGPGESDVDAVLAPEEELLEGWLPDAEPTDGPAPAP
jgi:hypothetical protein